MKKIILIPFLVSSLFAVDGEKVYEKACASCHIKTITKKETKKRFSTLKAPPMVEVSNQLKGNIKIVDDIDDMIHRGVVVAFIKDYVMNPDIEASMCHAMALEKFGVMPSQKGKLNEEELDAVAKWVYDYYIDKKFD